MSTAIIDRHGPTSAYAQLAEELRSAIAAGTWKPGDALPSEAQIATSYGVSRPTVRAALETLQRLRLIDKRKGSGSYVREPTAPAYLVRSLGAYFDDPALRAGLAVRSVVLRAQLEHLPEWAANALALPATADAVAVERLRWVDEQLALYSLTYILPEFATSLLEPGLEHESLYGRLAARHGLRIAGGRRSIEAVAADEKLATLLQMAVGQPLAYIEAVSWDDRNRPVECHRSWLRTDRLRIETRVGGEGPLGERYKRTSPIEQTAAPP